MKAQHHFFTPLSTLLLAACGSGGMIESQGTLATVDGKLKLVTPEEQAEVCDAAAREPEASEAAKDGVPAKESAVGCEPNYVYGIQMSRAAPRAAEPPRAAPAPAPAPAQKPAQRPAPKPVSAPAPAQPPRAVPSAAPRIAPSPEPRAAQPRAEEPAPEATGSPDPSIALAELVRGETLDYSRKRLGLQHAWKVTLGKPEIIVAVIDSGVDIHHPDLEDNIWVNERERDGRAGVDDDGNGYVDDVHGYDWVNDRGDGLDDQGHGTHCAGIIAGALNGSGTAGVAPRVRIMPLKFLARDGRGDTLAAVRAIDYAVAHGARVISNSWSGPGQSRYLRQAIERARARGVLVVAAAGNSSLDNDATPNYPASYDGVISVAASDRDDALAGFSNFGSRGGVTIAAPGAGIYSAAPGGGWTTMSGTSMAAPQVAGALALALSARPSLELLALEELLCSSAAPLLRDQARCGRLDVGALVAAATGGAGERAPRVRSLRLAANE